MQKLDQKLLDLRSVAELCGVSTFTVRRFAKRGDLPTVKLGRRVLFHPEDVSVFLERARGK